MNITNDPTNYTSIYFIDENTGWAVGLVIGFAVGCRIAKSTNGGLNWTCKLSNPFPILSDVHFTNTNTGWAAGESLFRTTNGGENWSNVFGAGGSIISVFARTEDSLYFAGARTINGQVTGFIGRSTNVGLTFDTVSVSNSRYIREIYYTENQTGWYAGESIFGSLLIKHTPQHGFVYHNVTGYDNNNFYSVFFLNQNTGWIGGNGIVLKTTNGGENWINQLTTHAIKVRSIQFTNGNTGWFCGDSLAGGKIYCSTNGGDSWIQQFVAAGNNPSLFIANENLGWAVGIGGNRRTTNGGFTGVELLSEKIPEKYALSQNYPNPFNPVTKIKFDIPSVGQRHAFDTKIIIYDLLGREVATLVNDQLKPGSYEVDWDGSGFASGVYFYSLVTPDYVETKRMVLLK